MSASESQAQETTSNARKPRSNFSIMWRMLGLVGPFVPVVVASVVCGVAGHLCATFLPVFAVRAALSQVGAAAPLTLSLTGVVGVLFVMAIARGVLHYLEQNCNHYIAFKLLAHVRDLIFANLRRLCPAKLAGADRGSLISTITSDVELLEVFYAHTISPVAIAIVFSAILLGYLSAKHWLLGLIALVAYLVVGAVVPIVISRRTGDAGARTRDQAARLSSFMLDSLRGMREVNQYGAGERRMEELDAESLRLVDAQRVIARKAGNASAAGGALVVVFSLIELFCGAALVSAGALAPAQAVLATVTLFSSFGPVSALAALGTTLQGTLASGARVLDVIDEEPLVVENETGADIAFTGAAAENVSFAYADGEQVLSNVNVSVPQGSIVGITGKSGSGKSTLCRLFMRFWDVDTGRIALSNTDVRDIRTASLRANEALVEQDTYLFHDSIRDNLRIAKPDATDDEIMEACRAASADELVKSLPHGLDTMVGELGDTLSGGERQRLGLARAFLHDAPFLLLDEPTSNLDSLNEGAILRSLDEQRGRRTILLISHRPSTMAIADKKVNIENGRVS